MSSKEFKSSFEVTLLRHKLETHVLQYDHWEVACATHAHACSLPLSLTLPLPLSLSHTNTHTRAHTHTHILKKTVSGYDIK